MKKTVAGLLAGTLVAALAACSAPGAGNAQPEPADAPESTDVVTDPASLGDVTLKLWDAEALEGQAAQFEQLVQSFQDKYPNIKIDRNSQSFEDMKLTLPTAVADANPPDVVQANNGRNDMGAFVESGLLADLGPWAEAYGWNQRFPATVLKNSTYSADGKTFGEGNLYGLSQMGEVVGVYYNKAKLAALGIDVPATWEDFEAALKKAHGAGETALMLGDSEGWPAGHTAGVLLGAYADPAVVTSLDMGNPGATWEREDTLKAIDALKQWIDAGYYNEGVNGQDDETVAKAFAGGEGVFYIAGSWQVALLDGVSPGGIGFIAPPAPNGRQLASLGGASQPYAVTAKSKNKDAAAAFIDYITSDEAMGILWETGNIPVVGADKLADDDSLLSQAARAFGEVTASGTLLPYLDWATPSFADEAMNPRLQDLFAGKIEPQGVIDAFEANYSEFAGR
ncbi:MAG: extracellular solute-binding protein [Bifidobacteriaceae bacterium]|jgi:raffinose/stachyose/melibiose transport system substrate-binding protein|nr:extracellular solute-binding protein [Bifidobacteriaceae bacterium]